MRVQINVTLKNSAYERNQISWTMRIVGPIQIKRKSAEGRVDEIIFTSLTIYYLCHCLQTIELSPINDIAFETIIQLLQF